MLFLFIIIKLTFEVQYYGSIELMSSNDKTRFSRLRLAITIKQPHFTGGPNFLLGGPAPSGP